MTAEREAIRNPLVVALDVATAAQALEITGRLRGLAGMFKVGMQLFTAAGPDIVRRITGLGERVFLDLKFHDIPNTVAGRGSRRRGWREHLQVHEPGGSAMMRARPRRSASAEAREGLARPLILGVTVLQALDQSGRSPSRHRVFVEEEVVRLARLCEPRAWTAVVASPQEMRR